MTDDPIRRAAEALARAAGFQGPDAWRNYVATVRTVLEAMDMPTATMVDAGNQAMREAWKDRGLEAPAVAGDAAVEATWQAMLDRLLEHA